MTYGKGLGGTFGGGPLVAIGQPSSEVGDTDPITFEFTDEPDDAPLPGGWEHFVFTFDPTYVATAEPDPTLYYRVYEGLGLWDYARNPSAGSPFEERGVAAAPRGVITGRNVRVSVVFESPLRLFRPAEDFTLELIVAVRASDDLGSYVGGRVRAVWGAASAWTTPLSLQAVQATASVPTVLATATFGPYNAVMDLWAASPRHMIDVTARDGTLTVALDNTIAVTHAPISLDRPSKVGIIARIYRRSGLLFTGVPAIAAVQLRTLRDEARMGPPPQVPGDRHYETPVLTQVELPVRDMEARGILRRVGARAWRFAQDVTTEVQGEMRTWRVGDVVRAVERYAGQPIVPVVIDLATARAERSGTAPGNG
jgi:hypothetical protein